MKTMKALVVVTSLVLVTAVTMESYCESVGSRLWKARKENQLRKKSISGTIIYGPFPGTYATFKKRAVYFKTPQVMRIVIRDVSIADASSKLIKTFVFRNVTSLPYTFKLDISDVVFYKGLTYSVTVHIDSDRDGKYSEMDYLNDVRHEIPFRKYPGDSVKLDVYLKKLTI